MMADKLTKEKKVELLFEEWKLAAEMAAPKCPDRTMLETIIAYEHEGKSISEPVSPEQIPGFGANRSQ